MLNHLLHDTDRDGWGSAALLVATFGPASCRLHPCAEKDPRALLAGMEVDAADRVWVLDLPAPPDWWGVRHRCALTWVDHHLLSWRESAPEWIQVVLPAHARRTTTMHVLVEHGLISVPRPMDWIALLTRRDVTSPWGDAFDAMRDPTDLELDTLPALLCGGPLGAPLPDELGGLASRSREDRADIRRTLESAPTRRATCLVRIDIADARRIALGRYSLEAARLYPGVVIAIVHRGRTLYLGTGSWTGRFDLHAHLAARGFTPRGHDYVCFAGIPGERMDAELAALDEALERST